MNDVSARYGLALFSIAKEENKISSLQEEIKILIAVLKENSEFINVLGSSFLTKEERIEMVNQTLKGFDENIISLINIVIENNRTNYLLDILYSFNSYCNEYFGVDEGYIYSAFKLDEQKIEQIEQKISSIENKKVELKNQIDPSLIGGVKIVIHDHIYDGSIKNKIENMKNDLLKKEAN